MTKASVFWHIHRSVRSSPLQLNLEISSPQRDPAALNITPSSSLILPQPLTTSHPIFSPYRFAYSGHFLQMLSYNTWSFMNLSRRGSSSRLVQYHQQEDAGTHRKKDTPRPRTKEKPQREGQRGAIALKSHPVPSRWATLILENNDTKDVLALLGRFSAP